jgi:hypothetical protein
MFRKLLKPLLIAILCAFLIGGSFSKDNFGLSQAFTGMMAPTYFWCDFCMLTPDTASQIDFKLPFSTDVATIILTTLFALVLAAPHLMPNKRKHTSSEVKLGAARDTSLAEPPWKAHFKKQKYYNSGAISPKRHAKFRVHTA